MSSLKVRGWGRALEVEGIAQAKAHTGQRAYATGLPGSGENRRLVGGGDWGGGARLGRLMSGAEEMGSWWLLHNIHNKERITRRS